jgi:hypothetical protein
LSGLRLDARSWGRRETSGRGARGSGEVRVGAVTRRGGLRGNPGIERRFESTSVKVSQEPQEGRRLRFATVGDAEPFVIDDSVVPVGS